MHLSLEPYLPIALLCSNTFSTVEKRRLEEENLLLSGMLCLAVNGISRFLSKCQGRDLRPKLLFRRLMQHFLSSTSYSGILERMVVEGFCNQPSSLEVHSPLSRAL